METLLETSMSKVVGLYGISGCGKSFQLRNLQERMDDSSYVFLDGSNILHNTVPGGLSAFEQLPDPEKRHWRETAIKNIGNTYRQKGKVVVIAGHYMFWSELEGSPRVVCTKADLETYSHVVYLDTPVDLVKERRLNDQHKTREFMSTQHLMRWQDREKLELRQVCYDNGILFSLVESDSKALDRLESMLRGLKYKSESSTEPSLCRKLDKAFHARRGQLKSFLVFDGDRTLTETDTGRSFWDLAHKRGYKTPSENPLKTLFSSGVGYSYKAFEQAALLYEDVGNQLDFDSMCQEVSSSTEMYAPFLSLFHILKSQEHIGIVLLTCGLQKAWEKVLEKYELLERVCVLGGGRWSDYSVVTGQTKAAIIRYIKMSYHTSVLAFGDSVLDLPMLSEADQGYVVVGLEERRSKTMEQALSNALRHSPFRGGQFLLPSTVKPRLASDVLPVVSLMDMTLIRNVIGSQYIPRPLEIVAATHKTAAKVLMTPMRNAHIQGPSLRDCHKRVGQYLTMEYLTKIVGIEKYPIPHVQGHSVDGYRLLREKDTMIVAMMRGGEPMALGVNDAIPAARFLHAKVPSDIRYEHLEDLVTVILVDSVINTGQSIVEFVQHINKLHATIHIVIVTGVAQRDSINIINDLQNRIQYNRLSLIALRVSDNKFTGKGTTDTGNRLFNTTALA